MDSVLLNVENSMVVLGTSYDHPVSSIFVHEQALRDAGFVGHVLIDGLLATGFTSNRFLKMYFDGQHFEYMNAEIVDVEQVSKAQLNVIYNWFKDNFEFVENNAILSNVQRYLLKRGLLLA